MKTFGKGILVYLAIMFVPCFIIRVVFNSIVGSTIFCLSIIMGIPILILLLILYKIMEFIDYKFF